MNDFYKAVGARIKGKRTELDISREEFSENISISSNFLYAIESGKKGFSVETLYKISQELNVSVEYILCGDVNNKDIQKLQNIIESFSKDKKTYIEEILDHIYNISNH